MKAEKKRLMTFVFYLISTAVRSEGSEGYRIDSRSFVFPLSGKYRGRIWYFSGSENFSFSSDYNYHSVCVLCTVADSF